MSSASTNGSSNRQKLVRTIIFFAKSHSPIIEESGKIGHGIYTPILPYGYFVSKISATLIQLKQDVLGLPPSAALPSNLSNYWLDLALQSTERAINADSETDYTHLELPLALVVHLLGPQMSTDALEMSDDQLFNYIKIYRLELAMEKLRRWGVRLSLPATESTIFDLE